MSGGRFNYAGANLGWIARDIEEIIDNNNNSELDNWGSPKGNWFNDNTIQELKKAVKILRLAEIYEHRVDWLLSGDDNEEGFIKRLKHDIDALEKEFENG